LLIQELHPRYEYLQVIACTAVQSGLHFAAETMLLSDESVPDSQLQPAKSPANTRATQ
jgi:hypothetical protein